MLAINFSDDLVNPPELGLMEALMPQVAGARYVLWPITEQTRGHGTHSLPALRKDELARFLTTLPASREQVGGSGAGARETIWWLHPVESRGPGHPTGV